MAYPKRFRVAIFVRARSHGFEATCAEFRDVRKSGVTEADAIRRVLIGASTRLRWIMENIGLIQERPVYRVDSSAGLETAMTDLLDAAYPGEGRGVLIQDILLP